MHESKFTAGLVALVALPTAALAQRNLDGQLVLESQGSFFVGGEVKTLDGAGPPAHVTINQMYVQFQVPPDGDEHLPVVMVHGCCLSSKTWETTPDGRIGWSEYFVRRGRPVYLADQSSRARSGFDGTIINAVRNGSAEASELPNVLMASHEIAWQVFRFGPSFGTPFADGQFPVESVNELYKQMIPDLNALLPSPNPTWTNMAALATQLDGAVLMGHSESGFFPEQAALIDPTGIRGMISIEMGCPVDLDAESIATLAKIPTLIMFGDHLDQVAGGPANWQMSFETCQSYIEQVDDAGGDALMMHLPNLGIHGNSHMLMQDRNSNELAELVLEWIDAHVEAN